MIIIIDGIKNQKNEFYLKQTNIKLCSVGGYYRFLSFDLSRILIECSVNEFYSLVIINYGTKNNHFGIILLNTCVKLRFTIQTRYMI